MSRGLYPAMIKSELCQMVTRFIQFLGFCSLIVGFLYGHSVYNWSRLIARAFVVSGELLNCRR